MGKSEKLEVRSKKQKPSRLTSHIFYNAETRRREDAEKIKTGLLF